ncbi:FAD-dependent oxidoreductase [Desulfonatronovibrio hydrogenovorans]|uniref:FAD-dependent oxidoreductase n=1 Tax=Desulfonatronovibrio hydrogenovorans TaxID=53245 RepID=UPI00048E6796|nr:FAD-dependent oxidoreductase [Desulfonatronovibrio hydrogenovorans]
MAKQVVVIGAVALGPKAACRFKRLEPESSVIMIDESRIISYGGCGIPYYISGDVSDARELQSTTFHMVRDARFFEQVKGVHVLTRTRALEIDRAARQVLIKDLESGKEDRLNYDKLVLATGSSPRKISLPGSNLENVFTVSGLEEAVKIKDSISRGSINRAVVIGAGFIGLEMAEALIDLWGIDTTVVEIAPQILPGFTSMAMSRMAKKVMEDNGVRFLLNEKVLELAGENSVSGVVTDKRELEADLVVMAVGVQPNSELARQAGLKISNQGAIIVDEYMRTSDPDIYAGGDCVEIANLVTGKAGYFPLGSMANRQGRVIGTNLAGGQDVFPGAVGSFAVKLFDHGVVGTGLSLEKAREEGYDALSTFVVQFDKSHFYPDNDLIYLELVFENNTGRILGLQGISTNKDGLKGRVDAVAVLLPHQPTTKDISNLELAYSPPFSSAMDALNNLGHTAENVLQGRNKEIGPEDFVRLWETRDQQDIIFLDCRDLENAAEYLQKYPDKWRNVSNESMSSNLDKVPRAETIVLVCNTGGRSYESQLRLRKIGIDNTLNVSGGMKLLKKWGLDI